MFFYFNLLFYLSTLEKLAQGSKSEKKILSYIC